MGEIVNKFPKELHYLDGRKRIIDKTRLLLSLTDSHTLEEIKALLQETGFVLEHEKKSKGTEFPMERINYSEKHFWIRLGDDESVNDEHINNLKEKFREELDWIGPVYQLLGEKGRQGFFCPIPNILIIQPALDFNGTHDEFSQKLAGYGINELTEESKYLGELRAYFIPNIENENAYQIKEKLENNNNNRELIHQILFDIMPMESPWFVVPNDTQFPHQWNMTRIRAGGLGTTAWNLTTGNQTVVICILDTGCDLLHPDLQFAGTGVRANTINDFPNVQDGSEVDLTDFGRGHGTACAGIAAAIINNSLGVAGVAGNCRIMPISLGISDLRFVAEGIDWAVTNGARVISMSFGNTNWIGTTIDQAIQRAFNRNVVLCASTGNKDTIVSYPARNALVMACGASDQDNNRQSPASPIQWLPSEPGSNFGPEMSVVAPGVRIPTTDRIGPNGFNDDPSILGGDFTQFSGTSAATPHVAGLAALIIGRRPNIRNTEVRNIIERSASKVGNVPYGPGQPHGLWNEEMGYGLIDAFKTLLTLRLCIAWKADDDKELSVMDVFDPSTKKMFPNFTSDDSPSVAKFNAPLWMAWRAEDDRLNVIDINKFSFNTTGLITLNEYTDDSPSITAFKNSLWIAWKAVDSEELSVMDVFDPSTKKVLANFTSKDSPSITEFVSSLWMAWRAEDEHRLEVVDVFDATRHIILNEFSDNSPSIASIDDHLWIAWKAVDGEELSVMDVRDPSSKITYHAYTSDYSPALAVIENSLWMAWIGQDDRLNVVDLFNASSVITFNHSSAMVFGEESDDSPGLSLS